jgi:lysophospholipase L1-like esterase
VDASGAASTTPPAAAFPFPATVTRPRIMIVGDSISAGPGCYKKYLLSELDAAGYTNFDFVGEYTDDCGGGVKHSAVSCSTAENFTQPSFSLPNCSQGTKFSGLSALAAKHRPDLIMIQLGVNDVWSARPVDAILGNYTTLLQQARAQNPNIVIAVAQIHKIRPKDGGDAVFARAQQLIEAVPAWAQTQDQPRSAVHVADLWTNSNPAETSDGVHPNEAGAQRMGRNWCNALKGILPAD